MAQQLSNSVLLHEHHLIIVTESQVQSWDNLGIHSIFSSGSRGILAAKELNDGHGTLALADRHLVLLHDVTKGMQRSYKLKGAEGEIRLLYFPTIADSSAQDILYFSTTLQNAVQRYSLKEARLLDCGPIHPSPPIALAISPQGHLLVSISHEPSLVYLQNLTYAGAPRLVSPQVSESSPVCVKFHPTRSNIFLLGCKDGSLGIYDATKLRSMNHGLPKFSPTSIEIKAFPNLLVSSNSTIKASSKHNRTDTTTHRPVAKMSSSVTDACFLPHRRSEVLVVGDNGKCVIVNFEKGSILKSWHAKGPVTSLSVLLAPITEVPEPTGTRKLRKSDTAAKQAKPSVIIAVGRLDGIVILFDDHGETLAEQRVDTDGGRIIDVEWVRGPTPAVLADPALAVSERASQRLLHGTSEATSSLKKLPQHHHMIDIPEQQPIKHAASTSKADDYLTPKSPVQSKFTEHLLDNDSMSADNTSTVRYLNPVQPTKLDIPRSSSYMDLFSPIKAQAIRVSPPRHRPKITNVTYERVMFPHHEATPDSTMTPVTKSPKSMLIPRRPISVSSSNDKISHPTSGRVSSNLLPQLGLVPNISGGLSVSQHRSNSGPGSSRASSNCQILADIQRLDKLSKIAGMRRIGGSLSSFAPGANVKSKKEIDTTFTKDDPDNLTSLTYLEKKKNHRDRPRSSSGSLRRASIGKVRVQKPNRIQRPRVPNQEVEHILLFKPGEEIGLPGILRHEGACIPCTDGSEEVTADPRSVTTSSVLTYNSEEQVRSTFSSDSSLTEESQATISSPPRIPALVPSKREMPQTDTSSTITPTSGTATVTSTEVRTASPEPVLHPGFAQSFDGPVEVAQYLPRRNSLNFATPGRTPTKTREPMSDLAVTNARRNHQLSAASPTLISKKPANSSHKHAAYTCAGCNDLKHEVAMLKSRQSELEQEVLGLRRMIKGKGVRAD